MSRVGIGVDAHSFSVDRRLVLGGVHIVGHPGLAGHSDADVAAHAVCDALLGASGLGDIGTHFPDSDPACKDADSMALLVQVAEMVRDAGYRVMNVDLTVIAETPAISPYRLAMCGNLANAIGIKPTDVNVKGTTAESMGFVGRKEGMVAVAVASLTEME